MISHGYMCGHHYKLKLHLHEPLTAVKLVFEFHDVWGQEVAMFTFNWVQDITDTEYEQDFELAFDIPMTQEFRQEFDFIVTKLNANNFFVGMVGVLACRTLEGVLHNMPIDRWQMVTDWALGKQRA